MASGYSGNVPSNGDLQNSYGYPNQQFINSGPMGISAPMQPIVGPPPNYMPHNQLTHCQGDLGLTSNIGGNSMVEIGSNQEEYMGDANRAAVSSLGAGPGRKKKKKQRSGEEGGKNSLLDDPSGLVDPSLPGLPHMTESQGVEDLVMSSLATTGDTLIAGQYLRNSSLLDQILAQKKMQLMQSPEVMEFLMKQVAKK